MEGWKSIDLIELLSFTERQHEETEGLEEAAAPHEVVANSNNHN